MRRTRIVLPIACLTFALPTGAQQPETVRDLHGIAGVAKWVLTGATLALGVYAYTEHQAAERVYSRLRDRCDASPEACTVVDGRYSDAESEALHQRSVRHDRRARTGIVAGQITLLGGVAFFLYDLRGNRGPDNIPYPSALRSPRPTLILGARIPFRP